MPRFALFSVSSPSRHPANQRAYDPGTHSYLADYVRPSSWVLRLSFFPAGASEGEEGPLSLPDEILSYRWTIDQLAGSFETEIERGRDNFVPQLDVQVPEPATYQITLTVRLSDGTIESSTLSVSVA